MPRPRRIRRICFQPDALFFKPAGIPLRHLVESILTFEEFEAIRLVDYEGMEQEKAAKQMKISQPTLSRLLLSGRKKIADALVNSKSIKIEGGTYKMIRGMGRGRMGGPFAAGPGGNCICPKCGYKMPHKAGVPCYKQECQKCGAKMTRET